VKTSLHLKIAVLVGYVVLCTLIVLSVQQTDAPSDMPSLQDVSGIE
jgi:hypothetical protein